MLQTTDRGQKTDNGVYRAARLQLKIQDLLNNQFQSVFGVVDPDERLPNVSDKSYRDMFNLHIKDEGVEKQLRNFVSSKASVPDQIPDMYLTTTAEQTAPIPTLIFNQSLQTGKLPSDWLSADVSPIFKKGVKHTAATTSQYPWPVSAASCLNTVLLDILGTI